MGSCFHNYNTPLKVDSIGKCSTSDWTPLLKLGTDYTLCFIVIVLY